MCVCNVSRPLYVSVRYLENSSFWLAEYGPGYSVVSRHFFLLSVLVLLLHTNLSNVMFTPHGNILHKIFCIMCMQNEQKLEFWLGDMPLECFPCLYREAMRLQCFPPTRYVKWVLILCLNDWRPFTTWLCKAHICSIIGVLQYMQIPSADAIFNSVAKRSLWPTLERCHVLILLNAHLRARPTQLLLFFWKSWILTRWIHET